MFGPPGDEHDASLLRGLFEGDERLAGGVELNSPRSTPRATEFGYEFLTPGQVGERMPERGPTEGSK